MLKKIAFNFLFTLALFLFPFEILFARSTSESYIIFGDVFSAGGSSTSTSASYSLHDTIGEATILSSTTTSETYGIKAGFQELYEDQYVTLTVAAGSSTTVSLGTLSDSSPGSGSHTLEVDTNATNGLTVTVTGSTLTSGSDTITAIGATGTASSSGSEQFGINLVDNATPNVGADASGTSPIASASAPYDTADEFAYVSGDTIASSSGAINETTFTVSYLANISASTESGTYSTTLTYAATANF